MYKTDQEGEKVMSSQNIQFPYYTKPNLGNFLL